MVGLIDESLMNEQVYELVGECMNGGVGGWMDEWVVDGWVDE